MESCKHFTPELPETRQPAKPFRARDAFSLVEVVIALGVIAFAVLATFGLLPTGLSRFRQAMDTSTSSRILQRVLNDAQETEFSELVKGIAAGATGVKAIRYFDDQGNEISSASNAIYQVNTRILPATILPAKTPVGNINLATVTVQVAKNPGNQNLVCETATGMENLWSGAIQGAPAAKVVPVATFNTLVAGNP